MDRTANRLIKKLKEKNLCLALAESMTCGLAAHRLSGCPGVADVFMGSIICYSPSVKTNLVGVAENTIKKYSAESEQVTDALAIKLRRVLKADIYAAITGLAAPGGSETKEKPVGTTFLSVYHNKKVYSKRKLFRGSPLEIRKKACDALYELILDCIRTEKKQKTKRT
jgi:nicotinamide-nucleotide amidase